MFKAEPCSLFCYPVNRNYQKLNKAKSKGRAHKGPSHFLKCNHASRKLLVLRSSDS